MIKLALPSTTCMKTLVRNIEGSGKDLVVSFKEDICDVIMASFPDE